MEHFNENERYLGQYSYNSKKSRVYKKLYYSFEIFVISATAIATILLTISNLPAYIPAILTGLSALAKSISYFVGFQKQWINCRTITETLKSEKIFYSMNIEKYKGLSEQDAKEIFVITIENIVKEGNKVWLKLNEHDKNK